MDLPAELRERPGDDPDDVVFGSKFSLRTIELNRPKKLNSLNDSMIRKILPRLMEWEKSDMANVVVMKGAGEKAFCAGGDVAALAELNKSTDDGWAKSAEYFGLEYKLDHYIATYQKPYVAFMDGITMGGGVGLSIHAPFRIATERTVFAMPETTIGFFPDVGASFFLPRMNGQVGTYLALTSDRLKGANTFYSGIATHYVNSTSLLDLEARLGELRFRDYDSLETRLRLINDTIEEFTTGIPHDEPIHIAGELRKAIDRCFSHGNIDEIIAALRNEKGATEEWAARTLEALQKRSPTSLHVTLRQMRTGSRWSIADTFRREHAMATKFMKHPDFTEGVSALLVRKDTPTWKPASLEEAAKVPGDIAAPFFAFEDVPENMRLRLMNNRDYTEYPHAHLGVPGESEVEEAVLAGGGRTRDQVVTEIVGRRNGRQGIKTVVREILDRKTSPGEGGAVRWHSD
ncbi:related to enoyl-CoA-hydratase [Cephalotrichum gorgonifer]|uniref:3-hydroxyisobutyryl-CoA hydrolase n=1 Tax=Cephalotrichum gorgonifer TaxID=2041049 RepID=A0AAE8N5Y0_9PEZI|nr:related to enoyl-CoA-hydratase [Cephalotrichum gorgonifer]